MPVAGPRAEDRAAAHYRWAERYHDNGDYKKAAAHFGRALDYSRGPLGSRPGFGVDDNLEAYDVMLAKYKWFLVKHDQYETSFPNHFRANEREMYERARASPGAELTRFEVQEAIKKNTSHVPDSRLEAYDVMLKKYKEFAVKYDGIPVPIRFFLDNQEDFYNEARMRPGAELASYEANPEPDTRLEEYEKMKKKYTSFRVDIDGFGTTFPYDESVYETMRAHPRAKLVVRERKRKLGDEGPLAGP